MELLHVNLMDSLEPNAPAEKLIYCAIIQDAVHHYLNAFTQKNVSNIEEFFSAHQYLFKVTSDKVVDQVKTRILKHSKEKSHILTDNELKLMCFDQHYQMAGLSGFIHIEKFRSMLKDKRRELLTQNWDKVKSIVDTIYNRELSQIADGRQVPLRVWGGDLMEVLVDPSTPLALASVFYVPKKLKRQVVKRPRARITISPNAELAKQLESGNIPVIDDTIYWGPLTKLLRGASDVEDAAHDSNSSVHSSTN